MGFQGSFCFRKLVQDPLLVYKGVGGTLGLLSGALAITAVLEDADLRKS